MCVCEFQVANGHSIVTVDGMKFVMDTGSLISFRFDGGDTLRFDDRTLNLSPMAQLLPSFVKKKDLEKLTGMPVDGMLGMDFLTSCSGILINTADHEIYFQHGCGIEPANIVSRIPFEVKQIMGIQPYIDIQADTENGKISLLFDTGSFVNYLNPRYINKQNPVGEVEDFSPEIGKIHTKTYCMDLRMNNEAHKMVVAEAPLKLRTQLSMTHCDGILGLCAFFEKYPVVFIDMRRREIVLAAC